MNELAATLTRPFRRAFVTTGVPDQSPNSAQPPFYSRRAVTAATPFLSVEDVSKTYPLASGEQLQVLQNINLQVARGEFVSLVGASGCGKTTLLRLIAGLETDYSGSISVNGQRITGPALSRGVVFQEPRLLPWLTVEQNTAFGLKGKARRQAQAIVEQHLELVGLKGFGSFYPPQLSGGMAQRAAIARALVNRPEILLLDEPLGALDALTRLRMQQELEKIWKAERIAMIMITHDVEEAVYLSDRVGIMASTPGRLPRILPISLPRPRNRDSAEFLRLKEEILKEFNLG